MLYPCNRYLRYYVSRCLYLEITYAVLIAAPKPFFRWRRWSTVILSYRNRKYIDLLRVLPKQFINMVYGDLWLLYKNRKLFSLLYKEKRIWIISICINYKCSSLIHIRFFYFKWYITQSCPIIKVSILTTIKVTEPINAGRLRVGDKHSVYVNDSILCQPQLRREKFGFQRGAFATVST